MNSRAMKNVVRNSVIKNIEEVELGLSEAEIFLDRAQELIKARKYEDAFPIVEEAEACCKVALDHLRELLP